MKFIKHITLGLAAATLFFACDPDNIDPISSVTPGADAGAPTVTITYPPQNFKIKVVEPVAPIRFDFTAVDDIELQSVKLVLDGTELASYTEFPDYRRLVASFTYESLTNGAHVAEVIATDLDGKSTTGTVNFEKVSPYTPKYAGEILYMPFDGDYNELVAFRTVTKVGSPSFAGETVLEDGNAYKGATDAYLTLDGNDFHNSELSASFWMKINAVPDRAGILVMSPPHPGAALPNNRTSGFRFFRENAGGKQRFKLNVGNGTADAWFDGGANADVDPTTNEWVHFAFSISQTEATVYINGQVVSTGALTGFDLTDCDILSIMSGVPRFVEWNHLSDLSYMDELRLFDRAISQSDVLKIIADAGGGTGYTPKFDGEMFYSPFEGAFRDMVSGSFPTEVGTPGFAGEGKGGDNAYAGAENSYLSFDASDLMKDEFSAAFWMKINATPDRAGILVIGPPDTDNPGAENKRTSGFRFFRENAGGLQRFKLNVGTGAGEQWFDGGSMADVDPATGEWVHFAFTISQSEATVYINGEVASTNAFDGVDWTDCSTLSVMSGAPHFTGWDHWSDLSYMDELRLFSKSLSQEEVKAVMDDAN